MAVEIILKKSFDGKFSVVDALGEEQARTLKIGKPYKFKVTGTRDIKFHSKFFVMLNEIYKNQEQFNNFEQFRKAIIFDSGFVEERMNLQGEIVLETKSISFANMDELEFERLYNAVIDTAVAWLGWDKEAFIEHLMSFI